MTKLNKWEKTGLLQGLTNQKQNELADLLEELSTKLIALEKKTQNTKLLLNVMFPIARKLVEKNVVTDASTLLNEFINWSKSFDKKSFKSNDEFEMELVKSFVSHKVNI